MVCHDYNDDDDDDDDDFGQGTWGQAALRKKDSWDRSSERSDSCQEMAKSYEDFFMKMMRIMMVILPMVIFILHMTLKLLVD